MEAAREVTPFQRAYDAIDAITPNEWKLIHGYVKKRCPSGRTDPRDIVQEAALRTLQGVRPWRYKQRDMKQHLLGVCWSLISHDWEKLQREISFDPAIMAERLPDGFRCWGFDAEPIPKKKPSTEGRVEIDNR